MTVVLVALYLAGSATAVAIVARATLAHLSDRRKDRP